MTRTVEDKTGRRYGRLVVLKLDPKHVPGKTQTKWVCVCDCGTKTVVFAGALARGKTTSCGCWQPEATAASNTKHGHSSKAEYYAYHNMLDRCLNEEHASYPDYGGRGIKICRRWLGKNGLENFLVDVGKRPPRTSLDRIDNNRGYTPTNVRWADGKTQANNRRMPRRA